MALSRRDDRQTDVDGHLSLRISVVNADAMSLLGRCAISLNSNWCRADLIDCIDI